MGFLVGSQKPQGQSMPAYTGILLPTSSAAIPITLLYGTNRISHNMIWYGNVVATAQSNSATSGGKGGGGQQGSSGYTYTAGAELALCAGPISNVLTVYDAEGAQITSLAALGGSLANGSSSQVANAWLSAFAPGQSLASRGVAYLVNSGWNMGSSTSMPQMSYEVQGLLTSGGNLDVNPADFIIDLMTNTTYGLGYPSANIGALTQFRNYCQAMGLLISPALTSQTSARDIIQQIVADCGAAFQESQGVLNILPYELSPITANGATYTPQTPQFNLTDNDFIYKKGEAPIKVIRKRPADTYNQINVEYVDRSYYYNPQLATYESLYLIRQYGLRPQSTESAHFFCTQAAALACAKLLMQRQHIRNTYQFTLGWSKVGLDPQDLVTVTDTKLGLNQQWVRITQIDEDEDGNLAMIAEDCLQAGWTIPGAKQSSLGQPPAQGGLAPNCYAPVIFEPPTVLCASANAPEVWIGVSGPAMWGGANIWLSLDGNNYKQIGVVNGPARTGSLTANLPTSSSQVDNTDTLSILLDNTTQQLLSSSAAELAALVPLYYVDGELIACETATLAAAGAYNLTTMMRGCYGSAIAAHTAPTARMMRLDQAVLHYQANPAYAGQKFYIKVQSFNIYGNGLQSLSSINPYTYTFIGMAYSALQGNPLPVSVPVGGVNISFQYPFPILPFVAPVILNPQNGDFPIVTNVSKTGFTLYALNYSTAFAGLLSGGTATADSSNGTNTPGYAVDGNLTTYWQPSGSFPHWWQYHLASSGTAQALNISVPALTTAAAFTLQASNTGAFSGEQVTLLTASMPISLSGATYSWYFGNSTAYLYYRLVFTTGDSSLELEEVNIQNGPLSVARNMNWSAVAALSTQSQSSGAGYGNTPYGTSFGN
jgi:hypothetical protein